MTNHWRDFKNADVILVIGANPAENHPCGWKWAHVGREDHGTRIIHVDPRFTRTSAIADRHVTIRAGTDIAFFGGLVNYILTKNKYQEEYVKIHTNAPFIVGPDFKFDDGLFSGYDKEKRAYDNTSWDYDGENPTEDGKVFAKLDPTLQDPRCVFQLLKQHFSRYTPEMVESITGIPVDTFEKVAEEYASTGVPEKAGSIVYALGLTHHTTGVQIIRALGIVQLLLGNVGIPGGGVNAERGHSNIQGNTDNAISWEILPGYLGIPRPGMETMADYLNTVPVKATSDLAINYFGVNYKKFLVSLMKTMYGDAATADNEFCYSWIPKPRVNSAWLTAHDEARAGRLEGIIYGGFHGVSVGPDSTRMAESLGGLKWLVALDPLPTTGSEFWRRPGVDPATINTEVLFLPTTHWIEKAGSFTNSGRWAQWKNKVLPPFANVRDDNWILAQVFLRMREMYRKDGGAFPDPILNMKWEYSDPNNPPMEEIAREVNGSDLTTGVLVNGFGELKDDGTTAAGNWLYCGSWTPAGNQMDRHGTDDPTGMGYFHDWAWSWPANRRILYNRASADAEGKPWKPSAPGIQWNGSKWVGDVPDFPATEPPSKGRGAFIMTGEGRGRLFAPRGLTADGPFPEHYEPTESPIDNPLSGIQRNPVTYLYEGAMETFSLDDSGEFPYVATTYRVTEHEHYLTQVVPYLNEAMPEFFVELPVELAKEKGIDNGGRVRVSSKRGAVEGVAVVTKRMRPLKLGGGKVVYQIGIPLHWHYAAGEGARTRKPVMANILTPYIGDANVRTPEFKGFLVNVEKA